MNIHSELRQKFQLPHTLFPVNGRLQFLDYPAIRQFLFAFNSTKKSAEQIYLGEMRASALLLEIYEYMLKAYEKEIITDVFSDVYNHLLKHLGENKIRRLSEDFVRNFPPGSVHAGQETAGHYLSGNTGGRNNSILVIKEIMLFCLADENPANKKMTVLFDKQSLSEQASLEQTAQNLETCFRGMPPFTSEKTDIFTLFRTPFRESPDDLFGQLEYVIKHWRHYLPDELVKQVLQGIDLMREDLQTAGFKGGQAPTVVPGYGKKETQGSLFLGKSGFDARKASGEDYDETERFTRDTHWMPRVVLLAKNAYVWLDQLSKKYQRNINQLDQIPDEELDKMAQWHFNALWLIGIWERSKASQKIKHLTGNPDAISSAYALYDYEIAAGLGGEQAYQNLNHRAKQKGIRLASDMVPNHTGIYSRWMIEHPDYFIQSPVSPFPNYSFSGENLSDHPGIDIRIEDGYYDKTDAAVVFQRIDKHNNTVRYIYHGNDGTMMPWNDTAQLDMLKGEVREAVMQKIFEVARKFSIIRFDAAMTLAKKHFSRLWYPAPGSGGDIPSRAEHAMTKETFDKYFPVEFWREVVDRINSELPETLLLAEAFWLMEGYFVRTLGMHRVYNSAFMHMLKNEENEKYRDLITNTLEFEPEILKRYVNFMSNPDEETAIRQFGTGDKYFGICVLMNTLPGLPMFAHGQIEGFTEKYGMEYQRAYYHEEPQQWLVEKHEREIFPLAGKRYLFSEVIHFQFYDFLNAQGHINENVFAFTNRHGDEKALVLFNNTYDTTEGHIKRSVPRLTDRQMTTTHLADALEMNPGAGFFYRLREHISGQEYLLKGEDIHKNGFYRHLQGFEYRVFIDFRELRDHDGSLERLYRDLAGQGTASVEVALGMQRLSAVHEAFLRMFDHENIQLFTENLIRAAQNAQQEESEKALMNRFRDFSQSVCTTFGLEGAGESVNEAFEQHLRAIPDAMHFLNISHRFLNPLLTGTIYSSPEDLVVLSGTNTYRENSLVMLAYLALRSVREGLHNNDIDLIAGMMPEPMLEKVMQQTGRSPADIERDKLLIMILVKYGASVFDFLDKKLPRGRKPAKDTDDPVVIDQKTMALNMLNDPLVKSYIGVNQHEGTWYYSKEQFEQLALWLFSAAYFAGFRKKTAPASKSRVPGAITRAVRLLLMINQLSEKAGYQLDKLRESLSS
ncbi:MAG: alpha-amylase [Bacteroidia bacterium]|nr:MAG: alpha-amylase [Bacteroidia bacterium]